MDSQNRGEIISKLLDNIYKKAEAGDPAAQRSLGLTKLDVARQLVQEKRSSLEISRAYSEAVNLLTSASENGDASAQATLGSLYRDGEGVLQDYSRALRLFESAHFQGEVLATHGLATLYLNGWGVEKNEERALDKFIEVAKSQCLIMAGLCYNVGTMYEIGMGTERNNVFAYAWYNIGASLGDQDSLVQRGNISKLMSASEIAEAQRMSSIIASELSHPYGQ